MGRDRWSLTRDKAQRAPRRRIIIYCEGKKTEPAYFKALERRFRDARIRDRDHPCRRADERRGASRRASDRRRTRERRSTQAKKLLRGARSSLGRFDVDEHPNFEQAVALCISKGVGVCRSNPCFEVWLILHEADHHNSDDRHAVCARLKTLRPEYDPNGSKICDFDQMIACVEIAETRAAAQLVKREQEGAPFGRPSTTAGELTAAIREAAARHRAKR